MLDKNSEILLRIIETSRDALLDWLGQPGAVCPESLEPEHMQQAVAHFVRILQAVSTAPIDLDAAEVSDVGEHGGELIRKLQAWVTVLELDEQVAGLAEAQVLFGLWIAHHHGEIRALEPVVDALAYIANHTSEPGQLEIMTRHTASIIKAVPEATRQDPENTDPDRPWRLLNLNYGIMATRSLNPELMRTSFTVLVHNIPDDAAEFFAEGMRQMDKLNYPPQVREVMQHYYAEWSRPHILH